MEELVIRGNKLIRLSNLAMTFGHDVIGYKKVKRIVRGKVCIDELPVVRRLSPAEVVSMFICSLVMTGLIYAVLTVLIGSAPAIQ